jgi:hypothetical protein
MALKSDMAAWLDNLVSGFGRSLANGNRFFYPHPFPPFAPGSAFGFLIQPPPCPDFLGVFFSGHGRVRTFQKLFFPDTAVSGVFKSFFSWARPCPEFSGAFFPGHGRVRSFWEFFFLATAVSGLLGSIFCQARRCPADFPA